MRQPNASKQGRQEQCLELWSARICRHVAMAKAARSSKTSTLNFQPELPTSASSLSYQPSLPTFTSNFHFQLSLPTSTSNFTTTTHKHLRPLTTTYGSSKYHSKCDEVPTQSATKYHTTTQSTTKYHTKYDEVPHKVRRSTI